MDDRVAPSGTQESDSHAFALSAEKEMSIAAGMKNMINFSPLSLFAALSLFTIAPVRSFANLDLQLVPCGDDKVWIAEHECPGLGCLIVRVTEHPLHSGHTLTGIGFFEHGAESLQTLLPDQVCETHTQVLGQLVTGSMTSAAVAKTQLDASITSTMNWLRQKQNEEVKVTREYDLDDGQKRYFTIECGPIAEVGSSAKLERRCSFGMSSFRSKHIDVNDKALNDIFYSGKELFKGTSSPEIMKGIQKRVDGLLEWSGLQQVE